MTAPAAQTGRFGEDTAVRLLLREGCAILARNWRCRFGEIDIVAREGEYLLFVEGKTRAKGSLLLPREAVTAAKQARLIKTAMCWMSAHPNVRLQPRFDVAEVVTGRAGEAGDVRYLRNAFTL